MPTYHPPLYIAVQCTWLYAMLPVGCTVDTSVYISVGTTYMRVGTGGTMYTVACTMFTVDL